MKIGIVLSKCHRFGSSRYLIETIPYFASKGHEIHLFANSWDPIEYPSVFFHRTPRFFSKNLVLREAANTFTNSFIQKFHKFDITLAQPTRYFTPDVGEMQFVYKAWIDYKRGAGVKDSVKVKIADSWLSWMERRNARKCKEFIALAGCVKKTMIEGYGIPEEKVAVCYSGVNLDEFNPKNKKIYRDEIRKRFKIKDDEKLILFVGNPFDRKGLHYLMKALVHIKGENFKLLVSGKDNPEPYIELSKKLGLEDKIVYNIGLTSEIRKMFGAADMFVFPTLYEPFGLVILEAMASGLPVITSEIAGAAELIDNYKDGIILKNPENVDEIGEGLKYLFKSDRKSELIGQKARAKAENYSWTRTAKCMLKVLERVGEGK